MAFVTIYETGSVSAAAERLHVSQPSISYTLKRLRDLLGEPLFKRTRDGMAPTYFATQLYEKFRIAISEIEGAIESTRKFDPYLSSRRFRLAMSDLGEIYLLPTSWRHSRRLRRTSGSILLPSGHQARGMAERGQNRCGCLQPGLCPGGLGRGSDIHRPLCMPRQQSAS